MKKPAIYFVICLASAMTSHIAIAADFGRLFTTPAERANLDYLRKTTKLPTIVPDQPVGIDEEIMPVVPPSVSIQGYVKRGDGKKGTVWLNGSPVQEGSDLGEVKVGKMRRDSNKVPIELQGAGKNLNLKAGQTYDPETNSVMEANAHAEKMAEVNAEDSGTIGTPVLPPQHNQLSDTLR